jgi:hypothetical protein
MSFVTQERIALTLYRHCHGEIDCGQLTREGMLFAYRDIGPSMGPIELRNQR